MPRTLQGKPVVPEVLHLYLTTAMVSGHLVTELIKNILWVCFASLETDGACHEIDELISKYLHSSRLPSIVTILVWSDNQRTALENLSMSSLFYVLHFALPIIDISSKLSNAQTNMQHCIWRCSVHQHPTLFFPMSYVPAVGCNTALLLPFR